MAVEDILTDADYTRLADFRYGLRKFLHFSEALAVSENLTPQQHQALLTIRGNAAGATNVAYLAERLCLKHHTTVELVQRLEKAGFVAKRQCPLDRRAVLLELTPDGAGRLDRLTRSHRAELTQLGPEILKLLSPFNSK